MRSPGEVAFRLRQELVNARLWWRCPRWRGATPGEIPELGVARADIGLAEETLAHRFRLLGYPPMELGRAIHWRRDPVHGRESGLEYSRLVPYLDFERVGDHKVIWELNRHQHLVVLAQAYRATGRGEFLEEIERELEGWMEQNPFHRGINWASALEVGWRALSWIQVFQAAGANLEAGLRRRWLESLYQHGVYLRNNLSVYFSPNTHLLGEAVSLHALGTFLGEEGWRRAGARLALEQMERQVRDDGSHFEQSTYYHLYALDLFLLHARIAGDAPPWFHQKLARMAEFLDALVSSKGLMPFLGDDDGGRLFHPYGDRRRFARETLEGCGPRREGQAHSRWFPDAGLAVMRSGAAHVMVDAGGFGAGSAGHSHADTLSVVAFHEGGELLIDPGTFTYTVDPAARERYRGAAAHNTIAIGGVEQAVARGAFRWERPPEVELLHWSPGERRDMVDARCRYGGFEHRRSVALEKPDLLVVVDRVAGPGEHTVEQRWLCPAGSEGSFLATFPAASAERAERSVAYGSSEPATRWVSRQEGRLPMVFAAAIGFGRVPRLGAVREAEGGVVVEYGGGEVWFPERW